AERSQINRRLPIGVEVLPRGGAHFRVWAPVSKAVAVELWGGAGGSRPSVTQLKPERGGYFSGGVPTARPGMLYKYRLDAGSFPDPASRFQPEGPHGPSQIV